MESLLPVLAPGLECKLPFVIMHCLQTTIVYAPWLQNLSIPSTLIIDSILTIITRKLVLPVQATT